MLDTTPHPHPAGCPCDSTPPPTSPACPLAASVPALFRLRVSPSVPQELYTILRGFHAQERMGPPKFFDVSLPACHGLRTPADLPILANMDGLVLPSVCVKTLGVRNKRHFEAVPALQGTRLPLRPTGYSVYASPILFTVSPRLRHGRKTRYGWVAHPYPTGTFTLQETPSFLGAITLGLSRRWKRKRGTSGRCKRSAAG